MSGQLRLPTVSARFARDQRQARAERIAAPADLVHGVCAELGCGWPGPLLVRDGDVVCPRCGCVNDGQAALL